MSRTNLMLALRNFKVFSPCIMDGIQTELKGNSDAYFIEGSDFSQFDAEAQSWNIIGEVVDANGGTPNCRWDKANGGCR